MELTRKQWLDNTSSFVWIKYQTKNEEKIQIIRDYLASRCSGWWYIDTYGKLISFQDNADMILFRIWLSDGPLGPSELDDEKEKL